MESCSEPSPGARCELHEGLASAPCHQPMWHSSGATRSGHSPLHLLRCLWQPAAHGQQQGHRQLCGGVGQHVGGVPHADPPARPDGALGQPQGAPLASPGWLPALCLSQVPRDILSALSPPATPFPQVVLAPPQHSNAPPALAGLG